MTRDEADAFLKWYEEAKTAYEASASAVSDDPATNDEWRILQGQLLAMFAPVADVVQVLFHAKPGEGLTMKTDKETHDVIEVNRAESPRVLVS